MATQNKWPKGMPIRKNALQAMRAKIHIAKKELGWDDHVYRSFLQLHGGHQSTKIMSYSDLDNVLKALKERAGWTPKKAVRKSANPQSRKIWALWLALYDAKIVETKNCRAFVEKQTGKSDPDFLSPTEANQVTEALKSWGKRVGANIF